MSATETPIPVVLWGRDHWSTFAYAGHVACRPDPTPDRNKMKAAPGNPMMGHVMALAALGDRGPWKYATKLRDGIVPREDHDDWDCIDDIVAAGLLKREGSGMHPLWELTEIGRAVWAYVVATRKTAGAMDNLTVEEIRAKVAGLPPGWPDAPAPDTLTADQVFAWRDVGRSLRIDGQPRPTAQGPRNDAAREGWDEQDARRALAEDAVHPSRAGTAGERAAILNETRKQVGEALSAATRKGHTPHAFEPDEHLDCFVCGEGRSDTMHVEDDTPSEPGGARA